MLRLSAALFCTAFGTLVCQLAWQRMLAPLTGSDPLPTTLVALAFLLGMALGGLLASHVADRLRPEIAARGVALCAGVMAVYAFFSKLLLYDVLASTLAGIGGGPPVAFAIAFAALALPSLLMGAVLPLAARAAVTTLDMVGERIGWLLALQAMGAGFGALLAGWLLFGLLGYSGAVAVTVALQLLAALMTLSLSTQRRYWSRKRRDARVRDRLARWSQPSGVAPPTQPPSGAGAGGLAYWCGLVALSAFAVAMLHLAWERLLGQFGQFHAYLAPTMLGFFLLAQSVGMVVSTRRLEGMTADPRPGFLAAHAIGLTVPLAMLLALWWALPFGPMTMLLPDTSRLDSEAFDLILLLVVLLVAVPGYRIGTALPLVQRAVHVDLDRVGARVGRLQAAGILGGMAGAVAGGLVAPSLIGTAGTLRLLALIALLAAAGWLRWAWPARRPGLRGMLSAPGTAFVAAAVLLLLPGNGGLWARAHGVAPATEHVAVEGRAGVALWRDDTLRREEDALPGPLFVQGHAQAAIPFRAQDVILGAVGPLMHGAPRRVLVLGVASGAAPWAAAALPGVQELRAVEPFPPVLDLLRQQAALRPGGPLPALLADQRVRIETGDPRRVLARSAPRSYDVIVLDSVPSRTAGAGLVHSRQYFELAQSRLAPGGIAVMAAPSWSVVQTFAAAFPFAVMYRPADVMIGSVDPLPSPRTRLLPRLAQQAITERLAGGDRERSIELVRQASGETLVWVPSTPRTDNPLTDMYPRDEFFLTNPVRPTRGVEMPEDIRADRARR